MFAAGDCAFGPDILIRAVGEGRRAAEAINLYLLGTKMEITQPYAISRGRLKDLDMADYSPRFIHKKRALETTFEAEDRLKNDGGWAPINVGLEQVQAMAEATRCIECGCNARFDCDLRDYSTAYGATEKKLAGDKRSYEEDTRHPLIRFESDKCITCASCVRICDEVRGIHALTFIDRGFTTKVGPNFNDPLQETGCDACGMCIDVCPTGTISANTGKESGPWIWETTTTTCTGCARGCGLGVHVARGRVVKISAIDNDPVNGAVICAEGRFGYQLMAKREEVALNGQVDEARALLDKAGSVAVVVSPKLTIEEAYSAAQLAKKYNASFHYAAGAGVQAGGKKLSKIRGEANVALLTRLGATPWDASTAADSVVMVNTEVDAAQTDSANVVVVNAHGGPKAGIHIPIADALETEGAFLNRDGALGSLACGLPDPGDKSGFKVLARLAGADNLTDLSDLRKALVDEVPELKSVIGLNGDARIVATDLAPELAAAGLDSREAAFAAHMEQMQLPWS